jgi:hypothetical protein
MEQVRGELALANAQELINVSGHRQFTIAEQSQVGFGKHAPCWSIVLIVSCQCTIENQRKVLLEVRPQAWLSLG